MEYSLLISDISPKIDKLQKELKLTPKISSWEFVSRTRGKSHRYSSVCLGPSGEKVIFYARLHKSLPEKERMKTEVLIARKLIGRKDLEILPRYFQAGIEKDFEWLTREYFFASSLESKKQIEKLVKSVSKEEIFAITKGIYELNHSFLSKLHFLKKFNIDKYLNSKKIVFHLLEERVLSETEADELAVFTKNKGNLLEKENRYFCHGDFQIANILSSQENIKIIDLESAHINNFAFDISFLFCRLWQEGNARKKIIKVYFENLSTKEKSIFPVLFRINSFFNSYHNFRAKPSKSEFSASRLAERKKFFKRAMKKAIIGFEELINI